MTIYKCDIAQVLELQEVMAISWQTEIVVTLSPSGFGRCGLSDYQVI